MNRTMKKGIALLLILTTLFSLNLISATGAGKTKSDAAYGNFRNVQVGTIGRNNLYRSQHPANGSYRAIFANRLTKQNKIQTVLNLSDSKTSLQRYFKRKKIKPTQYYRTLYSKGNVYTAYMNNKRNAAFRKKVANSLRFMTKRKGPYLIHCEVGRDRTGFVMLLLESLMGASYNYMLEDYAISLVNVNGYGKAKARRKAATALNKEFSHMTGKKKSTNWKKLKLAKYAEKYLKKGGMTAAEIAALKRNLTISYVN